jgi:hypothetical protein
MGENKRPIRQRGPITTNIVKRGDSLYLKIPPELHKFLEIQDLKDDEEANRIDQVEARGNTGEYGRYLEAWIPERQSGENE